MNDETLDRAVREAIEPDAETVARLMRQALHPDRPRRSVVRPVLMAVGVLLIAFGAMLLLKPEPLQRIPAQAGVTNVGDTIVVKPTTGGVWLIGGSAADVDPLATGTIIVYRSGERR